MTKAFSTDIGVEVASMGVQVHGGMGYIEETGAASLLRDARIAPIYEGTNGIQAIDLVTRKLPQSGGDHVKGSGKDHFKGSDAAAAAAASVVVMASVPFVPAVNTAVSPLEPVIVMTLPFRSISSITA